MTALENAEKRAAYLRHWITRATRRKGDLQGGIERIDEDIAEWNRELGKVEAEMRELEGER